MNGGTGFRLRSLVVTSLTTKVCCLCLGDNLGGLGFVVDQNLVLLDVLIETAGLNRLLADLEKPGIKRRRQFRS